jgi:hypothetical protein
LSARAGKNAQNCHDNSSVEKKENAGDACRHQRVNTASGGKGADTDPRRTHVFRLTSEAAVKRWMTRLRVVLGRLFCLLTSVRIDIIAYSPSLHVGLYHANLEPFAKYSHHFSDS